MNEKNYRPFYESGNKMFEKMASVCIVNELGLVEETVSSVNAFIEERVTKEAVKNSGIIKR